MNDYVEIKSSNIARAKYDEETETLTIEFIGKKCNTRYEYYGIPSIVQNGFFCTYSPGKYLNAVIKKMGYKYKKVSMEVINDSSELETEVK